MWNPSYGIVTKFIAYPFFFAKFIPYFTQIFFFIFNQIYPLCLILCQIYPSFFLKCIPFFSLNSSFIPSFFQTFNPFFSQKNLSRIPYFFQTYPLSLIFLQIYPLFSTKMYPLFFSLQMYPLAKLQKKKYEDNLLASCNKWIWAKIMKAKFGDVNIEKKNWKKQQ